MLSVIHLPYIQEPLTVLLNNIVLKFSTEFVISDTFSLYSQTMLLNNIVLKCLTEFDISDTFILFSNKMFDIVNQKQLIMFLKNVC